MLASDLPIPEPCSADWNAMRVVDGSRRHCGSCDKVVHDLSAMGDDEARALLARERVCVRYRTRTDGRIVHRPPVRYAMVRASSGVRVPAVARGLAAALGLVGFAPPAHAGSVVGSGSWFGWAVEVVVAAVEAVLGEEEEVLMGAIEYVPPPVDTGLEVPPVKGRPARPPVLMGAPPPRPVAPPPEPVR